MASSAREDAVSGDLLDALRRINTMLLTDVTSESAVARIATNALEALGLRGAVMLLEDGKLRVIEAATHPLIHRIELLSGLRTTGHLLDPRGVEVYEQVLAGGDAVYIEDITPVLRGLLPPAVRPFLSLFISSHQRDHGVYAPLRRGGQVIGLFNATGSTLTPADLPLMDLMAGGISLGLQQLAVRRGYHSTDRVELPSPRTMLEEQHAALNHHAIVTITDADGRITWANERFCELSGYTLDELLGNTHRLVASGVHPRAFFTDLWDTIIAGRVWRGELCNRAKDGRLLWLAATIVPLAGTNGRPRGYIAFRTDISALKAAEAELAHARDAAVRANDLKSRFLAMASHQVRTPMNAVIGLTGLVLDHVQGEDHEHLALALESATGLLTTLNDLLDLSMIDAGQLRLTPTTVALGPELERTLRPVTQLERARARAVECELAADLGTVTVDVARLRQVLNTLVGNALKHGSRGPVTVHARRDGAQVVLTVQDAGAGMTDEQLKTLLRPWDQPAGLLGPTPELSGLGVSTARLLVQLMGGTLSLRSQVGVGTTAEVVLPLPLQLPVPSTLSPAPRPVAPLQVLVAEDNPINQRVVQRLLEKRGHQVTLVDDGAAAVARARAGTFDVVLMDLDMPVMGGEAAALELRRLGVEVPIIAVTANAMRGDRERCLAAGMTDYLSKPISLDALEALLGKVAHRAG